jgi:hypothetical protein
MEIKPFYLTLILFCFSLGVGRADTWEQANAPENQPNWKAAGIGIGMLVAPIPFTGNGLDLGHTWELEGFSFTATYVFGQWLPKNEYIFAPIFAAFGCGAYRALEATPSTVDLERRKFACDLLGILGEISFEVKF